MTKQKIALIDKEVELQKLLEHLRAKCSAFHQVLEQEVAAFNKADDSQKTAIRTNKRAIVSIYSQLLKNKEELQNAKVRLQKSRTVPKLNLIKKIPASLPICRICRTLSFGTKESPMKKTRLKSIKRGAFYFIKRKINMLSDFNLV